MIRYDRIKTHTLRMCINNSTPRLRKYMWTDENVFKSMKELNEFFKGKRICRKGDVFYNFTIAQHEGKVMSADNPYYYQIITCERFVSWQKGYKDIIDNTTEMWSE